MTATLPPQQTNAPVSSSSPTGLPGLLFGALALVAIVIIALALSGTNKTLAVIIQAGLVIAILAVLVRDAGNQNVFVGAINSITKLAVSTSGKQSSA